MIATKGKSARQLASAWKALPRWARTAVLCKLRDEAAEASKYASESREFAASCKRTGLDPTGDLEQAEFGRKEAEAFRIAVSILWKAGEQ